MGRRCGNGLIRSRMLSRASLGARYSACSKVTLHFRLERGRTMSTNREIAELVTKYRAAAEGTEGSEPKRQNRCAREVRACYEVLRQSEAGRRGILTLLNDPSPAVRVWAASHGLAWAPESARATLEAIRDSRLFPHAFSAEMTLEEFDKGTLRFD
jgi:hypothetical protein